MTTQSQRPSYSVFSIGTEKFNRREDQCTALCSLEVNFKGLTSSSNVNVKIDQSNNNAENPRFLKYTYKSQKNIYLNDNPFNGELEIYLFKKQLNFYKDRSIKAELILQCSSHNGENLIICIPLKEETGNSNSIVFFQKLLSHINTDGTTKKAINVIAGDSLNLDNIFPRSPYYFADNTTAPHNPNISDAKVIIFPPSIALGIAREELNKIPRQSNYGSSTSGSSKMKFNLNGTMINRHSPDEGEDEIYIDCQKVDHNGNTIKNKTSISRMTTKDRRRLFRALLIFGGVIIGTLIIGVGYMVYMRYRKGVNKESLDTTIKNAGNVVTGKIREAGKQAVKGITDNFSVSTGNASVRGIGSSSTRNI